MEARVDQTQLQAWKDEIEQLQAKIRDAHVTVELGTTPSQAPAASTNAAPVNALCPVLGKPVDPARTVVQDGQVIAFCCDDCKAQFLKDPKPFLAKLSAAAPKETTPGPAK
jgi:YHS domain-containing protein